MKKLNRIFVGAVISIITIIVFIIGIGVTYGWNTWQSPDFHQTMGVNWPAVQKESQKHREILVFYKKGCPWCQALKPAVEKANQTINTTNPVKFVFIDVESKGGKDVRTNLAVKITTVPAIVPIEKGGRVVSHISFNGSEYNFPNTNQLVSAKNGVTKVTNKTQILVNNDVLKALQNGVWIND